MPRLSTYSCDELRAKAQKARDFALRCEAEADRKEAQKISSALLTSAKRMGIEPSKLIEKLSKVQQNRS